MAYDAEIRVKTKIDNSEVIKLEADLESTEKKAEEAGKALDQVTLNKETAETAQQAASGMENLADKTRRAAAEAQNLDDTFKDTKIHLADGTTLNWDGSVIEESIKNTQKLSDTADRSAESMRKLAEETREAVAAVYGTDTADQWQKLQAEAGEYMRVMEKLDSAGQTHGDTEYDAAYEGWKKAQAALSDYKKALGGASGETGANAVPDTDAGKQLTPLQNMLAFMKQSFQDIPILFSGIADKFTAKTRQMEGEWDNLSDKAAHYKGILQGLEGRGLGLGNQEYDDAYIKWQEAEQAVKDYKTQLAGAKKKHTDFASSLKRIGSFAQGIFKGMLATVKKFFSSTQSQAKKTGGVLGTMASRMKGLALSLLIFNWISKGFNAMVSGVKSGFDALAKQEASFAASIQSLKNALATLGNSIASAFAPIIQAAVPYLIELINWVNRAVNALGQLFAYLTGSTTWKKATEVQDAYKDALNGTAGAAKKAAGALAKFDDIDVLNKNTGGGGGGTTSGGFEEVPIDSEIKAFGDKIKDIMSKLFNPFKEAWEREGQFVMDSWKYALDEVKKLILDIGRDFLTVWNQEATIQMFADILHIIGDIGLTIGHLARNFREAWNENETGLHILENIRDIFAIIVGHVRNMADATVEWADKLDFGPLLTAFESFTGALEPVVDAISGILEDFYINVLLPLGNWVIEKGLPDLLKVLQEFLEKVDWESLRENFKDLWTHLEPFAETVGEGLILFIEKLCDLVAEFLNSETFSDFLDHLKGWMDNVTPEDVAEGIESLAKAFIGLKLALFALDGVIAGSKLITFLAGAKSLFGGAATEATMATGTFATAKDTLGIFSGTLGTARNALANMGPTVLILEEMKRIWENLFGPSEIKNVEDFSKGLEYLRGEYKDGKISLEEYNGGIAELVQKAEDAGIQVEEGLTEKLQAVNLFESGKNASKGFVQGFENGFEEGNEPMLGKFSGLVDDVKAKLGIHSPSTVFAEIGRFLIEGLLQGMQEMWASLQEWFATTFDNLSLFFTEKWIAIKEGAIEIWNGLKDGLAETWESIKESVSEKFEAVKDKFEEVWNAVKECIDLKVKGIQEKVKELGDKFTEFKTSVATTFTNIKDSIVNALSPVIDKLKEFIQWVKDAIQAVKDFFNSGYEQVGTTAGKTSKTTTTRSVMAASPASISAAIANIPHLATGAVIRGGNPFMALLGDQRMGQTNIEAPLSTIEQAVENVMSRRGYGGGGLNPVISLNVDGQEFARLTLQDILQEAKRQGYDVDVLGVT